MVPLLADSGIPMLVVVGILVAVVAVLGVVYLLHARSLSQGRKELFAYKEQVVALSDKIDALKERHKLLPHLEQKFTVPMSGETLAAYHEVAQRLEHFRQVWFDLMSTWEQAQSLLESERFLGSKRSREARKNLRAADAPTALAALQRECESPLDRIEQAHSQAATDLQSYREEDQRLGSQIDLVAAAKLSVVAYQPERTAAAALVERAQGLVPADPLAALRCLGEARGKVAELHRRATRILEHAAAARDLEKQIANVEQVASQRRSQGFFLREEGADPSPLLAESRQLHAAVGETLNRADDSAAGDLLKKGLALTEQARQGIERHVAAKARCESEIPQRQLDARRLADAVALARAQHAELSRDFVPDAWLGVADNPQRAQTNLAAAERSVELAAREAAPDVQHFLRAGQLLDQAASQQQQADSELQSVGKRLRELVEQRAACQAQIGQLRTRADRVHQLLQTNSADRPLANERYRAARLSLDRLADDSRQLRPDWTRLAARVKEIETDLDRAEQMAKADIQLAQQAAAEIAETERVIHEVRVFQQHGVSADVSVAEMQLAQARGSHAAQGYEEAIRLANLAEQTARSANQDAISRAQRRQQEIEALARAEQSAAVAYSTSQFENNPTCG